MTTPTKVLIEVEYKDVFTIRDSLDLAHRHLMDHRVLMRMLGQPVRTDPGPLRRRIVALQKNFPKHRFVDGEVVILPKGAECWSPHHGQDYPHPLTQSCFDTDAEYNKETR